jgi:hypothetical protein
MIAEQVGRLLSETLTELWARVGAFAPNVLAMLLILVVGIVATGLARIGTRLVLSAAGFDDFSSRTGLRTVLQRAGVTALPSVLLARLLAWTIFAGFVIVAIATLDVQVAGDLLSRALSYLPQLFVAIALLLLGALLGGFIRRTVLIAAVNAGVPSARFLATVAQGAVIVVAAAMALEHLGVGRQVMVIAFGIFLGGAVFALALALGLGGRELARDALRRWLQPPSGGSEPDDPRRHL